MALKECAKSCVHPSQVCLKILNFVENRATAGSGTNLESSYAQLATENLETMAYR